MNLLQQLSMPWWQFVVRGIVVYVALLCMMRLTGKRSFGEMSAFDLIVLMLVGGTLRTSIMVMSWETQLHYDHAIPKQRTPVGPRISLAFGVRGVSA